MNEGEDFFAEPQYLGDHRFFEMVGFDGLPPNGSLEGSSGSRASEGPYETSLIEKGETAWRTPYRHLTCGQVCLLLAQRIGLRWLAKPVLRFTLAHPDAYVSNYPDEMLLLSLRAADELRAAAPGEFQLLLEMAPDLIDRLFGWSKSELRRAMQILESAQA